MKCCCNVNYFSNKWFFFEFEDFFFQNQCFKWFLKYIFSTICIDLWHCIHCVKFDLDDQRSIPIYTHNNCHIKEWSALIYKYKKYHKTTNVNTTSLGHVLCQFSQTQNWTVLSSTYIQLLVFHCWERLHTVNMETNISSQYEWPKDTQGKLKPNADIVQHTYLVVWKSLPISRLL